MRRWRRERACRREPSSPRPSKPTAPAAAGPVEAPSGGSTALGTLIADQHLLSQVVPDFLVDLDKAWIEANLGHVAWSGQVDAVDALDRRRASSQHYDAVGERDRLFQVMRDEHHRCRRGRP